MNESKESFEAKYDQLVKELLVTAIRAKRPTFLSYATEGNDGQAEYHNSIVSAALEMPGYARRINKMILAVQGCDVKYPEHIQRSISELSDWLEREGIYEAEDVVDTPMYRKFVDIADGQMEAAIPQKLFVDEDDEEEIVTIKKTDSDNSEE